MKTRSIQRAWLPWIMISCAVLIVGPKSFASAASEQSHMIKGTVTQNQLIDRLETAGIKCAIKEGSTGKNSLVVQSVRPGSGAYYKGICSGDQIKNLNQNTGILTIERDNHIYQIAIDTSSNTTQRLTSASPKLDERTPGLPIANVKTHTPDIPVVDVNDRNAPVLNVNQKIPQPEVSDKENDKKLVPVDIELIIDISGSMEFYDGTGDLTKFQWCHEQVRDLAQRMAPYQKTFTITTFNRNFETMPECNAGKVEQIYATTHPVGGTDLVDPLVARLNAAYEKARANKHTLLIAVITDGLPNMPRDPSVVNRALIDFTQRLSAPDQAIVTFLQIGDTFDGRDFCLDLDDNLVSEGAKYDIVDTKTFAELKQEGMVNALIDAILEKRNGITAQRRPSMHFSGTPSRSAAAATAAAGQADQTLKSVEEERHEAERRLLGQ